MNERTRQPEREGNEYVLGTTGEELRRLAFQHRVWTGETFALWERSGIGRGQHLLDLGCGPGFTTIDLASLVGPQGSVTAVDKSAGFIEHLRMQEELHALGNIRRCLADFDHLDLPDGSLDGAFARWVLCWLKNPEDLIERTAAALRPGAFFAVLDYFNWGVISLVPDGEAMHRLKAASLEAWRAEGSDINIGPRLPEMFDRHGLRLEDIRPIARIARPGSLTWQWIESFLGIWAPKLVDKGLLTPEEEQKLHRSWQSHKTDPTAFCIAPTMTALIARKS